MVIEYIFYCSRPLELIKTSFISMNMYGLSGRQWHVPEKNVQSAISGNAVPYRKIRSNLMEMFTASESSLNIDIFFSYELLRRLLKCSTLFFTFSISPFNSIVFFLYIYLETQLLCACTFKGKHCYILLMNHSSF